MKSKKLLSALLSTAMVLGTMSVPVFASNVSSSTELCTAVKDGEATITLTDNVAADKANDYESYLNFNSDAVVDLAGKKLTKGNATYVGVNNGANVKFTSSVAGATIDFDSLGGEFFRVNNGMLTFENITFNKTGSEFANYLINMEPSADSYLNIKNCTVNGSSVKHLICAAYGSGKNTINIDNSSVTCDNDVFMGGTYVISGESTISGDVHQFTEAVYAIGNDVSFDYSGIKTATATVTASNGSKKAYDTVGEALKAAKSGETVTLYKDATFAKNVSGANRLTNASKLDLNGKSLSLPDDDYNFGEIEIANGTIEITCEESMGTAVFFQVDKDPITFNGVTINTNDYTAEGYVIGTNGGECLFKNSTINVSFEGEAKKIAAIFSPGDHNATSNVVIEDSNINISNARVKIALYGGVEVKGASEINANIVNNDGFVLNDNGSLKFTKTQSEGGEDKIPQVNLSVSGKDRYGIKLGATTPYTTDEGITVNTSVYRAASDENLADTVKVAFVEAEAEEGEALYDIYLETDSDKTINRLTTAEFAFDIETEDEALVSYEITGADYINVSYENGKYMFSFDGKNMPSATGSRIKIGQVKFTGYGAYTFTIVDGVAHATTTVDNIVTEYVKEPNADDETQGTLDIAASIEDENTVPSSALTINVDFPNKIVDNASAYQKMSVTIKGGDVNETVALGGELENGKYVIEKTLPKNINYTVTASGLGYRTASYSFKLENDVTLNFWNNVKDAGEAVEAGKTETTKKTTFLAGELVKDGQINMYDLSAVVSYFGLSKDETATEWDYVQYDLNRDGKIDSMDVSFVLSSLGN